MLFNLLCVLVKDIHSRPRDLCFLGVFLLSLVPVGATAASFAAIFSHLGESSLFPLWAASLVCSSLLQTVMCVKYVHQARVLRCTDADAESANAVAPMHNVAVELPPMIPAVPFAPIIEEPALASALSTDEIERIPKRLVTRASPSPQPPADATERELASPSPTPAAEDAVADGEDDSRETCTICYKPFQPTEQHFELQCPHSNNFHAHCLKRWMTERNRCPLCQHEIRVSAPQPLAAAPSAAV